jgi:LytR cell envelope-related transcriptional attenuator
MNHAATLGSSYVVAPRRNPARGEAFSAARGAGLIGAAVVVGIILLQVIDSPGSSGGGGGNGGGGGGTDSVVTQPTIDDTLPAAPDPASFSTIVLNASGESGVAQNLTNQLRGNGYLMLTPSNATMQEGITVQCQDSFQAAAEPLAAAVGGTVEAFETPPAGTGAEAANCIVYRGATAATTTST